MSKGLRGWGLGWAWMTFLWFYLAYLVSFINKTSKYFQLQKGWKSSHLLFSWWAGWLLSSFVETDSHVASAGFELLILLLPPPKCWHYRHALMPSFRIPAWLILYCWGCPFFRGEMTAEGFVGCPGEKEGQLGGNALGLTVSPDNWWASLWAMYAETSLLAMKSLFLQ